MAQPCGAKATPRREVPANHIVRRSSSPSVAVPDSACHAGGRGFESCRSRPVEMPANRHFVLSGQAPKSASWPKQTVAQTLREKRKRACSASLMNVGLPNSAICRDVEGSLTPGVVSPEAGCHAGGRGFESRRSRFLKMPADRHFTLSDQTLIFAPWPKRHGAMRPH